MHRGTVFLMMALMAPNALAQALTQAQLDAAKQAAIDRATAKPGIDLGGDAGGANNSTTDTLVGWWSGGECITIASSQGDMVHDVSGSQKEPQGFPLIIVKQHGQLQVEAHPMDVQLNRTLSYRIDGTHVHAEETSDQGVRGNIRDFTLSGDKLVGTYTTFDNYHRSRKVMSCELPKAPPLSAEEIESAIESMGGSLQVPPPPQ